MVHFNIFFAILFIYIGITVSQNESSYSNLNRKYSPILSQLSREINFNQTCNLLSSDEVRINDKLVIWDNTENKLYPLYDFSKTKMANVDENNVTLFVIYEKGETILYYYKDDYGRPSFPAIQKFYQIAIIQYPSKKCLGRFTFNGDKPSSNPWGPIPKPGINYAENVGLIEEPFKNYIYQL